MKSFELLQYNVHKPWDVMASFLRNKKALTADDWTATDDKKLMEFIKEHWTNMDLSRAGQTRIETHIDGVSMATGQDEWLRQKVAEHAVAKFMINSGLLEWFQAVDSVATGVEKGNET